MERGSVILRADPAGARIISDLGFHPWPVPTLAEAIIGLDSPLVSPKRLVMTDGQEGLTEVQRGQDPEPALVSYSKDALMDFSLGQNFLDPLAEVRGVRVEVVPEFADHRFDEVVSHLEVLDLINVKPLTRLSVDL